MRTAPVDALNGRVRSWLLVASVSSLLSLSGCGGDAPSGQVIATVDGAEITFAELNEEARTRNLDIAADRSLRDALLKELIERKLLVAEARRRKLDQTPEHILAQRRWEEIALGQLLLQTAAKEQGEVPDAVLRSFVRDHPEYFADRAMITADVAAVAPAVSKPLSQALEQAASREEIERLLAANNLQVRWTRQEWDSAAPPAGFGNLPRSGPFLIRANNQLVVGIVAGRRPTPVPPEQQLPVARSLMERLRAEEAMARILKKAQSTAEISFQQQASGKE